MTDLSQANTTAHAVTRQVIAEILATDSSDMPRDQSLESLGAESLDVVEFCIGIEASLGITIPDAEANKFRTVGDVLDYVDRATLAAANLGAEFHGRTWKA